STVCSFLVLYPRTVHALRCQSGVPTSNTSKDKSVVESDPPRSVNGDVDNNVCSGSSGNCGTMTSPNHVLVEIGSSSNGNLEPKNCPSICAKACVLESEPAISPLNAESKPLFLAKDWREKLCRCEKCLELYKQKRIGYLIDKEDSIAEYETKAKQKREEKLQKQEDVELDLFNNLGHVEKIEILNGIADFKDELRSFLVSGVQFTIVNPFSISSLSSKKCGFFFFCNSIILVIAYFLCHEFNVHSCRSLSIHQR
ncbi:Putative E3 ubiquitin-protein ligase UBR7, partial [Linum perenne]